jgi:glutamate synthase domain-containing protein 3
MSQVMDLSELSLRDLNARLHEATEGHFVVSNPRGAHAVAAGITSDITVEVEGSVGYYAAGMNQRGEVTIRGNAGTGVAENMMSGTVRVTGSTTMSAGASGCGGLLVIEGDAGARCGISMKGVDIVVGGDIGHIGAFMAQAGTLVVLGNADHHLGDSIYEAEIFVRGEVASLGADCVMKEMRHDDTDHLAELLERAGLKADVDDFRRYGSARQLYNFHVDDIDRELAESTRSGAHEHDRR